MTIEKLYLATQAGVQIDLIVRGMCSLRPGVAGLSERIRVVSIVDRFLEHARVFYFHNGGEASYWMASADWMPRNFDRRVEIAFPVLDEHHQVKLKEILEVQLADSIKGWQMQSDGAYLRSSGSVNDNSRSQERLYELMRSECSGFAVERLTDCFAVDAGLSNAALGEAMDTGGAARMNRVATTLT